MVHMPRKGFLRYPSSMLYLLWLEDQAFPSLPLCQRVSFVRVLLDSTLCPTLPPYSILILFHNYSCGVQRTYWSSSRWSWLYLIESTPACLRGESSAPRQSSRLPVRLSLRRASLRASWKVLLIMGGGWFSLSLCSAFLFLHPIPFCLVKLKRSP